MIAAVDEDHGAVARALIEGPLGSLVTAGIDGIKTFDTEADARAAVSADQAGAAVVIPSGFTPAIHDGTQTLVARGSAYAPRQPK